jgi:hypothetical protein|tara:strand:- start:320 stop:478 length:159 start_codon:yes stop_codon:yes gene_type:complete
MRKTNEYDDEEISEIAMGMFGRGLTNTDLAGVRIYLEAGYDLEDSLWLALDY